MYVKRWLGWVRNGVKTVWRGWTETGGVPPDISTAKKKDRLAAASPKSDCRPLPAPPSKKTAGREYKAR